MTDVEKMQFKIELFRAISATYSHNAETSAELATKVFNELMK